MDSLERLFRPRSVAVIGGGAVSVNIIRNCRKVGHAGAIWAVHPTRSEIDGVPAFASVDALPGVPDAAFVGVNRQATVKVVGALSARGAGGAVCYASGFRESVAETGDGADIQMQLLDAAGEMRFIGPNCYGFVNYLDGAALWPDQQGGQRVDRGVAIVSQSSNMAINMTMQRRGIPIGYVVAAGNQAQTSMAEIAQTLIKDRRVSALGLHVEGFGDLRRFEALAATARNLGKPVVVLKVGKSEQARAATLSHTASLAGARAGADALLARLGFAQVASIPAFLETLKLLHVNGPLRSNRIASLSCSGGEAGLIADLAVERELTFPPLNKQQSESLRRTLGTGVALANPLDYQTYVWGDEQALTDTVSGMAKGDLAMTCVIFDYPRMDRCRPEAWDPVLAAVKAIASGGAPVAVVSTFAETMPEDAALDLAAAGVTALCGMSEAIEALEAGAWLGRARPVASPLLLPVPARDVRTLSEADAKAELVAHALRVPVARVASSPGEASAIATEIGFPVVLKGEGLAHKTEAGAVVLNLKDAPGVEAAAETIPATSFLVEEMITGAVAELLIGVTLDPAHGYLLTLGAGGIMTELLNDTQSLLIPAREEEVRDALAALRVSKILAGYRGGQAASIDAILDAIMAVQRYVIAQQGRVEEVEVNPLICTASDAIAADALIRKGVLR